jgi:monoamine oxidase
MLSVSRAGRLEQVEAERVVLTIPFSVLRDVELDNSFSAQKRSAIANLQYFPLPRVHLQSRSRFWTRQGVSGSADTDLPIRTIVDHTSSQPGVRAILGTETSGPNARVATGMTPEERLRWGLRNVRRSSRKGRRILRVALQLFGTRSRVLWAPGLIMRPAR